MHRGCAVRAFFTRCGTRLGIVFAGLVLVLFAHPSVAQPVDCARLAAQIASLGERGQQHASRYRGALQKQRAELDRVIRQARGLGCDRGGFFLFDPPPPQCPGLNVQIQQLQASLAHYQTAGDNNETVRQQLTASYNAYCRGQAPARPQAPQPGFFEALFGAFSQNPNQAQLFPRPQMEEVLPFPGDDLTPRGGSQALCVRSCDGGFFPLSVSANHSEPDQLIALCQALCPNAEISVFTRSPYQDITTAVSLDGETPYSEMPNALRFQKSFDSACTCKPSGQSWAEALGPAEQLLGRVRKSDILVTPEKSAELARPRLENAARPGPATQLPAPAADQDSPLKSGDQAATQEITGPDGVKRRVRIIVPPL